jgi:hypothetical protein
MVLSRKSDIKKREKERHIKTERERKRTEQTELGIDRQRDDVVLHVKT